MQFVIFLACVIACAICNRARGSQLYGFVNSTTIGRLVSMAGIALVTTLRFMPHTLEYAAMIFTVSFVLLLFWCVWAWDSLWGMTIQGEERLKGVALLTLRMTLIIPFYIFLVYISGNWLHLVYANTALLLAGVYYIMGYIFPLPDIKSRVIIYSEMAVGAIIGATIFAIGL